jgi:four helix bundle protein
MAKWQRMWDGQDNQEVGLEAAILERKRNSSLVEQLSCAEDVTGLKPCTEAAGVRRQMIEGRGQQERASAFEELAVFQRAYAISLAVHRRSLDFPAIEQRGLADQVRRASKSICANLAEGWGRRGFAPADFRRFVVMAVGSADEMRVWTRYCLDLGYIDEAVWRLWCDEYTEISKMLQGLRKALEPSR